MENLSYEVFSSSSSPHSSYGLYLFDFFEKQLELNEKKSVRNQRDSTLAGGGCDCGSRSFPSSSLVFCALVESAEQSAWMYLNFALGIRQWYRHLESFPPKTAHKVLYPGYQFVSWSKFSEKDTYEKIQ